MTQKKYKICLVSECLSTGGAERVAALLSHFFTNKGIEVHHIIVIDSIAYDYSGELLNLGKLKNNSNDLLNKFKRFTVFKNYIKENKFDFIIEFRVKNNFFQEFIVSKWVYKSPVVFTIHNYMLHLYLPKQKWFAKNIHKKAYGMVTVSNGIKERILKDYDIKNTTTIYNPIDFSAIEQLSNEDTDIDFEYIVCAGRMNDRIKQFDKLIEAYAKSVLPSKNIKLLVLGDGRLRANLQVFAEKLDLSDKVVFLGNVKNPFKYYKKARFFVLSSKFEGLPMVIIESLACGTPVVSFDCPTGPKEIVVHNENGILVENQNNEKLIEAMNLLIENQELYSYCKQNAQTSVQRFSLENIGNQWLEYLKIKVS